MKTKNIVILLLVVQIIGLQLLTFFPEFVENNYSNGLYVYLSKFSRILLGWIPFSVGDIFYGLLIIWGIRWFFIHQKTHWKSKVASIISLVSVVYFLFHLLWAFNYYRLPLFEKMNIKREYTDEQLIQFTQKLIAKTNTIHFTITKNSSKPVQSPYDVNKIFEKVENGYQKLALQHPFFTYSNPSIKKSLFSYPLTYMGFGGYLNPFTNEAQVNSLPPKYNLPATTCHEMAHQMGFASESECNFIGFLASTQNEDLHFKYAGYTYALRYCLANIATKDEAKFNQLLKTIHPGILTNFQESEDFWMSHRSFIDKGFEIFYDHFLKMNQQKDGMESYSKFVDLLVNYYDKREL
ncbi:DUF3810 domain-containing protein [Flavobacterium amnicola]|uniref:DUF3810 domain-containing protein n=1 Tax=Flavobacterium amnicola TaxID=2506422 RepID=A0A4V1N1Q1_9FLAO|nr:DUF3810 domain-containing protein [Flavobacterium amnicola]RXR17230.1 DUF3810 domain-containing protein [Flavobacterium amnicola]